MTLVRRHITWLLIAVLTLTGHSMAIARGAHGAAGYLEICTGNGPVMLAVDANGEPTGESHICPEYTLMVQEALSAPDLEASPDQWSATVQAWVSDEVYLDPNGKSQQARAPPVFL